MIHDFSCGLLDQVFSQNKINSSVSVNNDLKYHERLCFCLRLHELWICNQNTTAPRIICTSVSVPHQKYKGKKGNVTKKDVAPLK